jgi:hypothetical protein
MSADINKKAKGLLFGVRRSIRYHLRRRKFFDNIHKASIFLSALSGTATIAAVLAKAGPTLTITFAALVAISSIIDLVVGTAQAARLHDDLARRFFDLEKAIISTKEITEENLTNFISQRLDIEADEPTPLKVLDSICHNELLRAMGYDRSEFLNIRWYQRISAQFFDFMEHKIRC